MSPHAAQIARLRAESQQLERKAYVLAGQLKDKLLTAEGRGRLSLELLQTECANTDKVAEIVRLQQEDYRLTTLREQQTRLF